MLFNVLLVGMVALFIYDKWKVAKGIAHQHYLANVKHAKSSILADLNLLHSVVAIHHHSKSAFINIPRGIRQVLSVYTPKQFRIPTLGKIGLLSKEGIFLEKPFEFRIETNITKENKTKRMVVYFQDDQFLQHISQTVGTECFLSHSKINSTLETHEIFEGGDFAIRCKAPCFTVRFLVAKHFEFICLSALIIIIFNAFLLFMSKGICLKFKAMEDLLYGCSKTMSALDEEMNGLLQKTSKHMQHFSSYIKTWMLTGNQEALKHLCSALDRFDIEQLCDPIEEEGVDFIFILKKAIDLNCYYLKRKSIRLIQKNLQKSLHLQCNVPILLRIVSSILCKSIESSKPGGKILISISKKDENIELRIQDHGYDASNYGKSFNMFKLAIKDIMRLAQKQCVKVEFKQVETVGNVCKLEIPFKKTQYNNVVPLFPN